MICTCTHNIDQHRSELSTLRAVLVNFQRRRPNLGAFPPLTQIPAHQSKSTHYDQGRCNSTQIDATRPQVHQKTRQLDPNRLTKRPRIDRKSTTSRPQFDRTSTRTDRTSTQIDHNPTQHDRRRMDRNPTPNQPHIGPNRPSVNPKLSQLDTTRPNSTQISLESTPHRPHQTRQNSPRS